MSIKVKEPFDRARCVDCKSSWPYNFLYMVHDHIWEKATTLKDRDLLICAPCLEKRLGAKLTKDDFADVPINAPIMYGASLTKEG